MSPEVISYLGMEGMMPEGLPHLSYLRSPAKPCCRNGYVGAAELHHIDRARWENGLPWLVPLVRALQAKLRPSPASTGNIPVQAAGGTNGDEAPAPAFKVT
jgi:hypothetical protein